MKNLKFLAIVSIVLLSGCFGQVEILNVKIIDANINPPEIISGQSTILSVRAKNNENKIVGPVILALEFKNKDKPYLAADEMIKNLGNLKEREDTGLRNFNITGTISPGEKTEYDIIVKVIVNGSTTDSKSLRLTVFAKS